MESVTKSWTELTIGALLVVSPWTLGFSDISIARWCNVIFGLVLIIINAWTIFGDPGIPVEAHHETKKESKTKHNVEKK
jgi:hypothetical protein